MSVVVFFILPFILVGYAIQAYTLYFFWYYFRTWFFVFVAFSAHGFAVTCWHYLMATNIDVGFPARYIVQVSALIDIFIVSIVLSKTARKSRIDLARSKEKLLSTYKEIAETEQIKTNFISMISHELQQPIQTIAVYAQLLLQSPPQETRAAYKSIHQSAQQLTELINRVTYISGIRRGNIQYIHTSVSLLAVVNTVIQGVPSSERNEDVKVVVDSEDNYIETDPFAFQQMLRNILANALRYTQAGSVNISWCRKGACIALKVMDTGAGIAQDELAHLFDADYHAKKISRHKGMGLGLSIVARLANDLNIKVNVESEVNEGTTFTLTIPAAKSLIV
jgi:two-component system, sensor histidine kinase ChiS